MGVSVTWTPVAGSRRKPIFVRVASSGPRRVKASYGGCLKTARTSICVTGKMLSYAVNGTCDQRQFFDVEARFRGGIST